MARCPSKTEDRTLEQKFESELQGARPSLIVYSRPTQSIGKRASRQSELLIRTDGSRCARTACGVNAAEVRVVKDIEGLGAELHVHLLGKRKHPLNGDVRLRFSKPAEKVARGGANPILTCCRDTEHGRIDLPPTGNPLLVYIGVLTVVVQQTRELIASRGISQCGAAHF